MPSVEPWSSSDVTSVPKCDAWVVALSSAGVLFMLLGFVVLALPEANEGILVWQLDPLHAIYLMDVAGAFALGLGVGLTWLSGRLWNRKMMA